MDFLGNILSGQDLVNKDYVDKAIPVVPTKLSELTDDILSGKYLLLSGGTINGNLSVNNGNIVSNYASGGVFLKNGASFYFNDSTGTNRKVLRLTSNTLQLGSTALETSITSGGTIALSTNTSVNGILTVATDITTPLINGGTPIHSNNYSSYALPISGGTIEGNGAGLLVINRKDGNPVIEFRHNGSIMGRYGFATDGTPIGVVAGSQVTLIHSGNIGDYALKKVANVTSLNTNAGEFFYSGFRPAHIPYGNYVGGITLQTFLDAENDYRTQLAFSTDAKGFVRSYTNGSWSDWKTIAFTDSNVASAIKLETPRTIWGQSFDGTGDVSGALYLGTGTIRSSKSGTDRVFLDFGSAGDPYIGYGTASAGIDTHLCGNNIYLHYGTSRTNGLILNSSGNVTIGSSDTAGADYKLRVDGKSRFTDRVSVTSLRIVPVNGSFAADFAMDGSSLTLNRELKFTNVTASDICSGIAAAFKTSLAQTENLIARNIILGASSGSASNLAFSFQKYTSISNTAPNGLTTLMTLTTDGNLGIGTTNPAYKLDVAGSIGCTGGFAAPYFHKSDEFYIGSGALGVSASGALIYTYNNLPIYFFTSGTAAMTIDSGHRVTMEAGLHVKGNFHAGSTWSEDGTSGTAGVTLRNEGGIELTHASTPYIDFHYAAGTTDFSHRLIARTSTVFAYSGNYFCPWGSESLGASSYRWKAVYAKAGSFSNDVEINGALTVGAGATFNGDVVINGNLIVKGDVTSA